MKGRTGARSFVLSAAVASSVVFAGVAGAEPSNADRALAQQLFDDARALSEAGKWTEACPKFAESEKLDPSGGTLLNLALCHENVGLYATAWIEFNDAAAIAVRDGRADRESFAREHIEALRPKLSHVRIDASKVAGIPDVTFAINGQTVRSVAAPVPLDPGTHRLVVSASGWKPKTIAFDLGANGASTNVDVGTLERAPASKEVTPADTGTSSRRTWAFVIGGVGIAALGTGAAFGLSALSKNDESNALCPATQCTDARAVALADDAITHAWVASAAIGVGIVALAVSGYLFLTR